MRGMKSNPLTIVGFLLFENGRSLAGDRYQATDCALPIEFEVQRRQKYG